jgi:transglutaminase-like putative cysteine protease
MSYTSRWNRLVSLALCLGMILQSVAPAAAITLPPAPATSALLAPAPQLEPMAANAATAIQPDGLAQPLTVARVQSSYAPAAALVITYTLRNNLAPQTQPVAPPNATITETVAALAAYDPAADPNTLHNVMLLATPAAGGALSAASLPGAAVDGRHIFQLGNLPPQASATLVVTMSAAGAVSASTPLLAATGWASLAGRTVAAEAAPAVVLPPDFSQWLVRTMDADTADVEMLAALAQTGGDPAAIFAFVRGLGYEAYRGSLRGTRGTLWSQAGNSLDQSSLLIAMLRAAGIPARYRHGALNQAAAQTLIAGMFPTPTTILGQVEDGAPVSDPVNDPALLAAAQDHWWVEAFFDGEWRELDPSFANAAVGQRFASQIAGDGTDQIAEAPDAWRPKVTVRLDVESFSQLNLGSQLATTTYLEHTFRVVEVATAALLFGHLVATDQQGGAVFANTLHTYTPFFSVDDSDVLIFGAPYQELLTNFPLATTVVSGAWLHFSLADIDGGVTEYTRTLIDRLGFDVRTYGGQPTFALDGSSPGAFSEFDMYSIGLFPGRVAPSALAARRAAMTAVAGEMGADTARMQELTSLGALTAEQQAAASALRARHQRNLGVFLNGVSLTFAEAADRASQAAQTALFVKAYHAAPRLVILSHETGDDGGSQVNVDLRTTRERTVAYPGQGEPATAGFNLFKGINESWLEGEVIAAPGGGTVLTTAQVMIAAAQQGIDFVFLDAAALDLLATLDLTNEAKARITAAVQGGKIVSIPTAAPLIDGAPAIGWWEIDPASGETIGVMANGLHNAFTEYFAMLFLGTTVGKLTDFMIGATAATYDFLGKNVFKATGNGAFGTPAKDALGDMNNGLACVLKGEVVTGCLGQGKGYLDYGYMAMEALLDYLDTNDPPLPGLLIGDTTFVPVQTRASGVLAVAAAVSPGEIRADLQTSLVHLEDGGGLSLYAAAQDALASGVSGGAAPVNHTPSVALAPSAAQVRIAAPTGSLSVAGQPVAPGAGVGIANFSGALAVTATVPLTDRVTLAGAGALYTLDVAPRASTIAPVGAAAFAASLTATFAGSFTLTVAAPAGWQVTLAGAQVTATPPPGAAPGVYAVVVTAQPASHPGLILTAEHLVTVTPHSGMQLELRPDPLTTVPMGTKLNPDSLVNTGQAQVPGAAYIVEIANTGNAPRTYTVGVSGLPGGWTLLGGEPRTNATLALPPGATGQLGLYVTPGVLPAPGVAHTINVAVSDDAGQNANASAQFVMPAVAFSYVTVTPASQAVASTGEATFDVTVTNVGNAAGAFGVTPRAYNFDGTLGFDALGPPVNLAPGASATFPVTVVADGAPPRRTVPLFYGSPVANTVYTPTALAEVTVVSAVAEPFLAAANRCEQNPTVAAAFAALVAAVDELDYWCAEGDCSPVLRDRVAAAGADLASYARSAAQPVMLPSVAVVENAAAALASQSGSAAILAGVADLGDAVHALSGELCQVTQHRAAARFTPYIDAILLGGTASFSLDVTNHGSLATTYAVTVTGLPGGAVQQQVTLAPGATTSLPIAATPASLGVYDLAATVTPLAPGLTLAMTARAAARLNVVDRFVQVTEVSADPPFVETGGSSAAIAATVANLAGVAQFATARTTVTGPDGVQRFSADAPVTVLAGNPRRYDLATVNTSGWAMGVYTVSVRLLDGGALIPNGAGYGFLSVGQGLEVAQAVAPAVVAPGTVEVTAIFTTTLAGVVDNQRRGGIYALAPSAPRQGASALADLPAPPPGDLASAGAVSVLGGAAESVLRRATEAGAVFMPLVAVDAQGAATSAAAVPQPRANGPAFTRLEQDDPAFTYTGSAGTWVGANLAAASSGSYSRTNVADNTVALNFTGSWVSLGFIGFNRGGYAEVLIDGSSRGIVDLYRNQEAPISFRYTGLNNGPHTLEIRALGSGNPFSIQFHVFFDYVDYGDGSALPDGAFEQDDSRVLLSNGWRSNNYAGASGGTYIDSTNATAWFPFSGDSFSLQGLAYSGAGRVQLSVDGRYLDTIDLFLPVFFSAAVTRTFAYNGLGAGPHVLQVMAYQNAATIDRFDAPGQAPFVNPNPPVSGITRFEADEPAIRYNGAPFTQTAPSWGRIDGIFAYLASANEYHWSSTVNDTISFDFTGTWLGIGFVTEARGGQAAIAIDGQPVRTVDLYTRYDDTAYHTFSGLSNGAHTVTITVLNTRHANATGNRVQFDFFDVWDSQPLASGTFQEDNPRLYYGAGWGRASTPDASGGAYGYTGINIDSTVWFPFTGDSVTWQAWMSTSGDLADLRIDGVSRGAFNLYSLTAGPRAYSFTGLGSGPHMLEIRQYRRPATVDAFITPAIGPGYTPPDPAAIFRYEEDHPAMRYNGYPFNIIPQSWALHASGATWQRSGSNNMVSSTAGDVWSLAFTGVWVNLGFGSAANSGQAEIFIDGVSRGVFDTANGVNGVKSIAFGGLAPGSHVVSATVVSGPVLPDYIDVWDGQPMSTGWHNGDLEDESGRFHFSYTDWWQRGTNQYAYAEDFLQTFVSASSNIWFSFVGTDLTVLGFNRANTALTVVIDGVNRGTFDMTPAYSEQPFALHFPDLGEGAHIVQVHVPSTARVDAFNVNPANFASHTPVVEWRDLAAKTSLTTTYGTGFASSIAIGDLSGDGTVELVAPGLNGRLYVYRGDGQDAGNGTPIRWTSDLVGPAAEPALADLDDDGKAEIIVSGKNGAFAFRHDGSLLWQNPAVVSYYPNEALGWGGPTVGNLDLDPAPEVVVAASDDALYVLDIQGNVVFSDTIGRWATVPVLADITGDGMLDIIVAQNWTLKVYDYFNGGQIAWSYTLTETLNILGGAGVFGAPAVADLNEDGRPEIIINWGHIVDAFQDEGTLLWRYRTNANNLFRPSAITVADVDGDGEMNVVTASAVSGGFVIFNHLLMVLDAQGARLWDQLVADNTASASGVAAQDLTGDGIWDILWNGATDGFLVIRGADGKRLFNEPVTGSGTVLDYPTLGDVDGDGYAEVVVAGREGIFVIGHDELWADSRPLWNQHNYHVTNINDDWSTPAAEQNSWELYNTYRTQTPNRTPAPSYQIAFTYTAGAPGVTVLTPTASISLTAAPPLYTWDYRQERIQPVVTTTFASRLTGLQPGETRQVAAGTVAAWRLPSGMNYLTLPPLYVTAARLGELTPATASAAIGASARYTLTLTNPGPPAAVYTLTVSGLPAAWVNLPASAPLAAARRWPCRSPSRSRPARRRMCCPCWWMSTTAAAAWRNCTRR